MRMLPRSKLPSGLGLASLWMRCSARLASWADFATGNDAPELGVGASNRALWTYFESGPPRPSRLMSSQTVEPSGHRASLPGPGDDRR